MVFNRGEALQAYQELYGLLDEKQMVIWDKAWGEAVDFRSHLESLKEFCIWLDDHLETLAERNS